MDTEYLKTHFSTCLSLCLAEIAEIRPKDPIEYLAQSLYKYVDNVEYLSKEKQMALQLQKEMEEYMVLQEKNRVLQEERAVLKKKQDEEAAARREEELREAERMAAGQNLPTLSEATEDIKEEAESRGSVEPTEPTQETDIPTVEQTAEQTSDVPAEQVPETSADATVEETVEEQ